jgi:hypothetical protein
VTEELQPNLGPDPLRRLDISHTYKVFTFFKGEGRERNILSVLNVVILKHEII